MCHSVYKLRQKKQRIKQCGVALITALLVVSLATIMAVALTSQQYIDIRRTGNMMQSDQAYLDAIAAETFVGQLLANFRAQQESVSDDVSLFDLALVQLSGDMSDDTRLVSLQAVYPEAQFNVNTLVNADDTVNAIQRTVYRRLLKSVIIELGGDAGQVDSLVSSLIDWIDKNENSLIDGAEDSVYGGKDPPYKAANQMLVSISELRLIEGYTAELLDGIPANEEQEIEAIDGLLAVVSALPDRSTKLSINGVFKPKIFEALGTYFELSMAEDLIKAAPFEDMSDFISNETFNTLRRADLNDLNQQLAAYRGNLSLQSNYFLIKSFVTVGKTTVGLNSLIYVNNDGTKLEVVSRAIGTDGI